MRVRLIDGPQKDKVISCEGRRQISLFVRYGCVTEEFEYEIRKIALQSAWSGGTILAETFVGVLDDGDHWITPEEHDWEFVEIKPDFENRFEAWFDYTVAKHADWSDQKKVRDMCMGYLRERVSSNKEVKLFV